MVWKCSNPACGRENEDAEDYCTECGMQKGSGAIATPSPPLQSAQAPEAQPPPPEEPSQGLQPASVTQAPEAKLELVKTSIPLSSEFLVTNGKSLGRSAENDIILPDTYVSRKHARISFENGEYMIEDLGSTNGTFLNENNIQGQGKQSLKNGDELRFGTSVFRFTTA